MNISLDTLREIAETGSPEEWLRVYWPTAADVPEPCHFGCHCGCEPLYAEMIERATVADAIRAQLPAAVVAEIERDVLAAQARTEARIAEALRPTVAAAVAA